MRTALNLNKFISRRKKRPSPYAITDLTIVKMFVRALEHTIYRGLYGRDFDALLQDQLAPPRRSRPQVNNV